MTVEVVTQKRRTTLLRAMWVAMVGVLPLAITGTAMAGAGALPLPASHDALQAAFSSLEPMAGYQASDVSPFITAPGSLESADYTGSIQQITIKFPPPPEPDPPAGGTSGGGTSGGGTSGGGTSGGGTSGGGTSSDTEDDTSSGSTSINHIEWCAANSSQYHATSTSASSMLTAVNKERARNGAPALKANSSLASKATNYSKEMATRSNDNPDIVFGSQEFFEKVFYHSSSPGAGENLFIMSSGTSWSIAHQELMNSQGHCANIMNPALKTFGVGVQSADNGWWLLTQNYGR